MTLERWLALGSLALFAMFSAELNSVYYFMAEVRAVDDFEPFEADPKILQFVSIGAAPAGILAAISFIMSRQYGSRQAGSLIMGGGAALLAGMLVCGTFVERIPPGISTGAVELAPGLFAALSAPVFASGALLLRTRERPRLF